MRIKGHTTKETLAAFSLIAIIVCAAFWRLTSMQGFIITDDIFTSDIMNEGFPYRFSMSESLKQGHLPLWVPEIYGGFPLLARAEAGVAYPINIILFALLSPWVALNVVLLLTIITAGSSAYLYAREIGASFTGSLVAAVGFGFSGYLLSHLKHLSNVNAACWLPLGLYLIERAIRSGDNRKLLFFGLVFGLQHLSGHTQVAYYSGLLYISYFLFRSLALKEGPKGGEPILKKLKLLAAGRQSWLFAGMLMLGSLIAAVQLIPTYELVSLSQRSGGVTFEYASNYSYDPKNLGMFLYPYINGDIGNLTYTGNSIFWEDYGYVGIITLLFALHAVFRNWKNFHVRFFTVASVISLIMVLGPNTPVYRFAFDYLPGMKFFRFPTRFLLITDLSLVVLASIGVTDFVERFIPKNNRSGPRSGGLGRFLKVRPAELLILLLCAADLLYFQLRQNPVVDAERWLTPPESVGFVKRDEGIFRYFSIGANQAHMAAFRNAGGWQGDLQPFISQREFIQPSSNVLYGIQSANGYANLTPNYIVDIWGDQNRAGIVNKTASIDGNRFRPTFAFWRLMDMHNVRYISSAWPVELVPGVKEAGKFGDAYFYRNSNSLPRAYLVGKFRRASSQEEAIRAIISPGFNPASEAILLEGPDDPGGPGRVDGSAEISEYTPNKVKLRVTASAQCMLILTDSFYPGWKAYVDGKESAIYRANVTQRGVQLSGGGGHEVEFRFEPESVRTGFWLTIVASFLFAVIFFQTGRKKKDEKIS